MKLKRVYSTIIPFKGYLAITIFPWIFIRKELKSKYTEEVHRHETTHGYQQLELLWLLFFVWYVVEWFLKIPFCGFSGKRAYKSISFEREAFDHENDADYNDNRKHYAWVKKVFRVKKRLR